MAKKDTATAEPTPDQDEEGAAPARTFSPEIEAAAIAIEASIVEYTGDLKWSQILKEKDAAEALERNRGLLRQSIADGDDFALDAVRTTLHAIIRQNQGGGGPEWFSALSRIVTTAVKVARTFL